jgi:hypothetical protein
LVQRGRILNPHLAEDRVSRVSDIQEIDLVGGASNLLSHQHSLRALHITLTGAIPNYAAYVVRI